MEITPYITKPHIKSITLATSAGRFWQVWVTDKHNPTMRFMWAVCESWSQAIKFLEDWYYRQEPEYYCGAQYCDDPVCGSHGCNWKEWRKQYE